MKQRATWNRIAQLVVVLSCAVTLKLYYSTASPNQLRWILGPTTRLVELVSGWQFEFESYAGYMSSDHTFLIAASCAGVNFLITSFLMLSLTKLWRDRSGNRSVNLAWKFIPIAALCAYLTTLIANTVRISTALRLHRMPLETSWLSGSQLHRLEGIVIYFGFLLLLFVISERLSSADASRASGAHTSHTAGLLWQSFFPLLIYYATTLGVPLTNVAFRRGTAAADFWEHSIFVLLSPLLLILPLVTFRLYRAKRVEARARLNFRPSLEPDHPHIRPVHPFRLGKLTDLR